MLYVMNATLDDLCDFNKEAKRAMKKKFGRKRLPKKFVARVPGEGALADIPGENSAELIFDGGGLMNGKLYHLLAAEFHYRNDATRHHWGEVPLETKLPPQLEQAVAMTDLLTNCLRCGDVPGVLVFPEMHADSLAHGDSTDDRHRLVLAFEYPRFATQDFVNVALAMLGFKPFKCLTCGRRCEEHDRDLNWRCMAPAEAGACGGECVETPFSLSEVMDVDVDERPSEQPAEPLAAGAGTDRVD